MIVFWRKIAVSTFASRAESSCPPADAVIASATERCSGARSGLGRPHVICCSARRSGSAYANFPSSSASAVCSAASSWSLNAIAGRWKLSERSE